MLDLKPRQIEIIQAAGSILTEKGLSGLTTKNLAARMGFGESALYRHFQSKEEVILAMLRYLADTMDKRLRLCVAPHVAPEAKIQAIFRSQLDFFAESPQYLVAIFSEGLLEESPKINEAIKSIMLTKKNHLTDAIRQGQASGAFVGDLPAEDLAHMLMGSFRLLMLRWRMADFSFDVKQSGRDLMQNLYKLIKTKNNA